MTSDLLSHRLRGLISVTGITAALFSPYLTAAPFTVYEHIPGNTNINFAAMGMPRMDTTNGGDLWNASHAKGDRCGPVDQLEANNTARGAAGQPKTVVDIEQSCWALKFQTSDADLTRRMNFFKNIIHIYHTQAPNTKVSFYSQPPRNWNESKQGINSQAMKDWQAETRKYGSLMGPGVDTVDMCTPSLYTFDRDPATFKTYAETMIAECKRFGKPTYPFIWNRYHPAGSVPGGSDVLIEGPFWRQQLEWIKAAGADGVVIWTRPEPLDTSAPFWKETLNFIAGMDNSTPPGQAPGTLQFSASSYSVKEGDSATITVTRTGGSKGVVSVDYITADGTTTDGADYAFTNGSLTFAAGVTASKTFAVSTMNDTDVEGDETVKLSLSNPDGGATLGPRQTAVLTIADNDSVSDETCGGQAATIIGTPNGDTIAGTSGPDVIAGLGGNDVIRGKQGDDIICGGDGDDELYGGAGNDQLLGELGNDRLNGRGGADQCDGGGQSGDRVVGCQ